MWVTHRRGEEERRAGAGKEWVARGRWQESKQASPLHGRRAGWKACRCVRALQPSDGVPKICSPPRPRWRRSPKTCSPPPPSLGAPAAVPAAANRQPSAALLRSARQPGRDRRAVKWGRDHRWQLASPAPAQVSGWAGDSAPTAGPELRSPSPEASSPCSARADAEVSPRSSPRCRSPSSQA
jgi:hypothetical protein